MKIQSNGFQSIEQLQDQYLNKNQVLKGLQENATSFHELLAQKSNVLDNELKFSKHAVNRLHDRNIELSDEQLTRLKDAATKASEKGINESLVLIDSLAFIVNVPNSTVVTAMEQGQTNEQVFTNIDGAVVV